MKNHKNILNYFTKEEILLWSLSILAIIISFFIFKSDNNLILTASIVGVTSLIFNAKGNPFGQILMILFSLLYGIISFHCAYYGEMITYIGMTMPMAVFALIAWLKNPYNGKKSQVKINHIKKKEWYFMSILTILVTIIFYFILAYFQTANLTLSTLSVSTTFIAVYLTFRRNSYYAIAYACNDIVLIILWILASINESSYISVIICFVAFLANDIYGFINWEKMSKQQKLNQ